MTSYDVAIVGGGASGLSTAALLSRCQKLNIAVFEGGPRAGKKLAASGNGQGNLSNAHISADNYYGGGKNLAADIIKKHGDVYLRLFYGKFICDERGRIYPAGKQASSLTDCLLRQAANRGVSLFTNCKITSVSGKDEFILKTATGQSITSKFVVLCTGGKAQKQFGTDGSGYALAQSFGHRITLLFPSLVQLKTSTEHIKTLRGIRCDCRARAFFEGKEIKSSRGDVIFTEYGISGNAVFELSAAVADKRNVEISLEFAPDFTEQEIAADIKEKKLQGYDTSELLACTLNNQVGRAIIRRCASDDEFDIAHMVKNFSLPVTGTLGFDYAQVTKGGIDVKDVKKNLESAIKDNLFFAGEILDVDGDCGGYNLTWAFASAAEVAEEIAKRL